jgi:hypothetical protein
MAGLFSKLTSSMSVAGKRRMGMLGQQVKNQGGMAVKGTAGALGIARWASQHPMQTTAGAIGAYAVFSYGSDQTQAIPFGPAEERQRPNSLSDNRYDLGASGNLVFALHRLNQ